MTTGCLRKYSIAIMDASDLQKVGRIFTFVDEILENRCAGRKATWRLLDENHPTTVVIEMEIGEFTDVILQKKIEEMYPGLCVFDPHI